MPFTPEHRLMAPQNATSLLAFVKELKPEHASLQENKRKQKLQCSHYKAEKSLYSHPLPIVVYCHCNSGSRRDAEEALYVLLPQGISVFCMDFAVGACVAKAMLCWLLAPGACKHCRLCSSCFLQIPFGRPCSCQQQVERFSGCST